jgi:hypothetical protein
VLNEIRSRLGDGHFRVAQRLAAEAAARFPEQPEVSRMNRALNERQVWTRPASGRDTAQEFRWLKNPPESVRGMWVAVLGSDVVAASENPEDLLDSLRSKDLSRSPLVLRVE